MNKLVIYTPQYFMESELKIHLEYLFFFLSVRNGERYGTGQYLYILTQETIQKSLNNS